MERQPRPALRLQIPPQPHLRPPNTDSSTGSFIVRLHVPRQPRPADDGPRAPPSISPFVFANGMLPPRPHDIGSMDIYVRPGEPRDLPHLLKIQPASTQNLRTSVNLRTWLRWRARHTTYGEVHLRNCLRDGKLWVAVAELATGENWIVGFATGIPQDRWNREGPRDNVLYFTIHVHVSVRRMGVGSQLLKQIEQDMWERGFDYLVASAFMQEPWKEPEETFLKKNDFQRLNTLGWRNGMCPLPLIMATLLILNKQYSEIQPGMQRTLWIKDLPPRPGSKRYGDVTPPSDESTPESYEWPSLRRLLAEDD